MSTDILNTTQFANLDTQSSRSILRVLQRVGWMVLAIIVVLVSLLSTIPVTLLFVITAVPLLIALALVLLDVSIIGLFLLLGRTLSTGIGASIGLILVSIIAVYLSQVYASTPPIHTSNGIASLEKFELNGSEQWITIRGEDINNPILLFLAGGPGGSELAMTRKYLGDLEAHFTIVNWDQPGTGKSYRSVPFDQLTPERYVADAHALTRHLHERFGQDKIYVFGESWGSIIGIKLVQQYPELFHAFISIGQIVDVFETDIQMYEFAIAQAIEQDNTEALDTLRQNGPPPYDSSTLIGKFGTMNGIVNHYMDAHAHGEGTGHNLMLDSLGAQEYGLLDKAYWLLGLARTFTTVYPKVYDVDFRTQATNLDVPVYFIKGRWDMNASNSLLKEYYALLDAPYKELIWFEDSAHTPSWDEPNHFIDVMVNMVLAETK